MLQHKQLTSSGYIRLSPENEATVLTMITFLVEIFKLLIGRRDATCEKLIELLNDSGLGAGYGCSGFVIG